MHACSHGPIEERNSLCVYIGFHPLKICEFFVSDNPIPSCQLLVHSTCMCGQRFQNSDGPSERIRTFINNVKNYYDAQFLWNTIYEYEISCWNILLVCVYVMSAFLVLEYVLIGSFSISILWLYNVLCTDFVHFFLWSVLKKCLLF